MSDVVEPGQGRPLEAFNQIRTRESFEVNGSAVEAVVRAQARGAGDPTSISSVVPGAAQYQYSNIDMRLIRIGSRRLLVEFMSPWAEGVGYKDLDDRLFQYDTESVPVARDGAVPAASRDLVPRKNWPEDTDPLVKDLRQKLGELLFPEGRVQTCYGICTNRLRENKQLGLRLRLFVYDPVIAAIPWETALFSDDYIGRRVRFPVVRYVIGEGDTKFAEGPGPLQFLGVICHPKDSGNIDAQREKDLIAEALSKLEPRVLECQWLVQRTANDLYDELRRHNYDILHFIGHGTYDTKTKTGSLLFCDGEGKSNPLPVEDFLTIIQEFNLQFAMLNACDSGHEAGGIAEYLVRWVLPAAVGMRRSVKDEVAIDFAQYFYEALGDRMPVDAALSEARKKLSLDNKLKAQWALPLLYMRAIDGKLL
jgi:CHAT domain